MFEGIICGQAWLIVSSGHKGDSDITQRSGEKAVVKPSSFQRPFDNGIRTQNYVSAHTYTQNTYK
jgi:hypothetical protein